MLGTSCMPCGSSTLGFAPMNHQGLHLSLMHRAAEADLQGASIYYTAKSHVTYGGNLMQYVLVCSTLQLVNMTSTQSEA